MALYLRGKPPCVAEPCKVRAALASLRCLLVVFNLLLVSGILPGTNGWGPRNGFRGNTYGVK